MKISRLIFSLLVIVSIFAFTGASVDAQNTGGTSTPSSNSQTDTTLIEATKNADIEIVKVLLAKGADVNFKDQDGMTALMFAAPTLSPAPEAAGEIKAHANRDIAKH